MSSDESWLGSGIYEEFVVESHENLDQLERDLVTLERAPDDADTLASIFRTMHTIKGTAGVLGFSRLESLTHTAENLLGRLREGELVLSADMTTLLLATSDLVRRMLLAIEQQGEEGDHDAGPLIQQLSALQDVVFESAPSEPTQVLQAVSPAPVMPAPTAGSPEETAIRLAEPGGDERGSGLSESNIRVDVGLLDKLMTLVGELVLTRNQILQFNSTHRFPTFNATTQRLNLITTELQESVMKTRMQPIGSVWSRFPRVARDLSGTLGKRVRIEMEGRETELDKTIVEAIKDPLTHIVRNAIDHGLERPEARIAAGKSAEGLLLLRAFHEGGLVNIEIVDDGAGILPEKVRDRAVGRGLVTPEQVARMGERDLVNLIFLPGFSTAEQVTSVSGRGVGMDVVKTNVERIGGTIEVQSEPGRGTCMKIKIPLTLAIIPALLVGTGGERYAIPQVSLLELVRLEGPEGRRRIEFIHDAPVYRLRGNLLPLCSLRRELRLQGSGGPDDFRGNDDEVINIVVLQADERQFGLVVDDINDTEEIVVKPLSPQLRNVPVFAGATIMGDGRVALILDVLGLAQRAHVVSEVGDRAAVDRKETSQESTDPAQTVLLCAAGGCERLAIPLSIVARLEELPRQRVERAMGGEVVQYRGDILPLIHVDRFVSGPAARPPAGDTVHVVVIRLGERTVGLVVDAIDDIVAEHLEIRTTTKPGLVGCAVIGQRIADLLDVPAIVRAHDESLALAPSTGGPR